MIDFHIYPLGDWGVRPILFYIGNTPVPSYTFFIALAFIVGLLVYFLEAKKSKSLGESNIYIIFGALIGGAIGAKLLDFVIEYRYFLENSPGLDAIFFGKTIVGGLIGGLVGVKIAKKIFKINEKKGNLFAPAIAIGVAIGRLGCFFRGCCYGKATFLPWGVNFGDGILRHPTQIYESIFMFAMFIYLESRKKDSKPGQLFKILMLYYFIFRFFIEFIRVGSIFMFGLTAFQIISLFVIIYLVKDDLIKLLLKSKNYVK